jgi:hypothetical protein
MNNSIVKLETVIKGMCFSVLLLTLSAAAQSKPWTTVASAGTIDDADIAKIKFVNGEASLDPALPAGTTATIRYNVVAVDNLLLLGTPQMTVRYQDNGVGAQVIVRLKRYNFDPGGAPSVMIEFDSDDFGPFGAFQTRTVNGCGSPLFDFVHNAYFVEVEMRKLSNEGVPRMGVVKLDIFGNILCGQ